MVTHQGTYRFAAQYKTVPSAAGFFTLPKLIRWTPTLGLWGGSALVAVLYFADSIPIYRKEILNKTPGIGWYYNDFIEPEDNPF